MPRHLTPTTIDDRIRRYLTREPLALIARDHNITLNTLYDTIRRHAPNTLGHRTRGGGARPWPPA